METFSAELSLCAGYSPVTVEFPAQRPVTRSFDAFCDLNKRLYKQSWGWKFEAPSRSLWRHYNACSMKPTFENGNEIPLNAIEMGMLETQWKHWEILKYFSCGINYLQTWFREPVAEAFLILGPTRYVLLEGSPYTCNSPPCLKGMSMLSLGMSIRWPLIRT